MTAILPTVYTVVVTVNFTPDAIGGDPQPTFDAIDEAVSDLFENGLADLDVNANADVRAYRRGLVDGDSL